MSNKLHALNPFLTLDKVALIELLTRFHPRDVLSILKTDRRFLAFSRDPTIFFELLSRHYPEKCYPDNFSIADPRKQYIAITRGVETIYTLEMIHPRTGNLAHDQVNLQFNNPVRLGKSMQPELHPEWTFFNVYRSRILKLLEKLMFITSNTNLFSKEDLAELSSAKYKIETWRGSQLPYDGVFMSGRNPAIYPIVATITRHFLRFMAVYRIHGLLYILTSKSKSPQTEESSESAPSEFSVYASQCYIRQFEVLLNKILFQGMGYAYMKQNRFWLPVSGLGVPSGITMWVFLKYGNSAPVLSRTRNEMARCFANKYFKKINKGLLIGFERYMIDQYPEHSFPFGTNVDQTVFIGGVKMSSGAFFSEYLRVKKIEVPNKGRLIETAMTQPHWQRQIDYLGDITVLFRPLTF